MSRVKWLNADNIFDHKLVSCTIQIPITKFTQEFVTFRDFSLFDELSFLQELQLTELRNIFYMENIDNKLNFIIEFNVKNFERNAPLKTARIKNFYLELERKQLSFQYPRLLNQRNQ